MRILIASTLKRRIGPDVFASRSRIIYELAHGLAKRGHSVSLLGTGDSSVSGVEVIPVIEKGWLDLPPVENEFMREVASLQKMGETLISLQDKFDIVHNHAYPDSFASIYEDKLRIPLVTTLHAVASDYLDELFSFYPKTNFVALSDTYRNLYKKTKIKKVIYNGVDASLYSYNEKPEDYLLWVGRLPKGKSPSGGFLDPKGARWAIKLAKETGQKLFLLGPCEDRDFFDKDIKPELNEKIQWVGEVSPEQSVPIGKVVELMKNAKALLMTISQDEPFGLVMAESMSCGTPVVAFNRGSVSEIVIDGVTGFIVDPDDVSRPGKGSWKIKEQGILGLVEASKRIEEIERYACRRHIEENFTVEHMVESYEKLFSDLTRKNARFTIFKR